MRTQFCRTQWDAHLHVSVLMTSTPENWSPGSHYCTRSSHLWPSVLPCAGQLPPCWHGLHTGKAYSSSCHFSVLYAVLRMPWWLSLNISAYKAKDSISLCGQVLDMCIPIKVMLNSGPKYLAWTWAWSTASRTWPYRTYWCLIGYGPG